MDAIARSLARGDGFALPSAGGSKPTASSPPLAPWLLGMDYGVFGTRTMTAALLWCLIGALTPILVGWMGASLFGSPVGRIAGWVSALDPLLVLRGPSLAQQSVLGAALVLALGLSAAWLKTPRRGRALGLGLAWGWCALASVVALPIPLVVIGWAWVPLGLTVPPGERRRQIGLIALGATLVVLPWTARNAIVLRAAAPVTTSAGVALLAGNNADVWDTPALRGGALDVLAREPYAGRLASLPEGERDRRAAWSALQFLSGRLRDWPAVAMARLARLWDPRWEREEAAARAPSSRGAGRPPGAIDPVMAASLLLFPLGLWGAARAFVGQRRWFQALPVLVLAYFAAVAAAFFGMQRDRVPVEPLLVLLSSLGLEDLRRRLRVRRRGLRLVERRAV